MRTIIFIAAFIFLSLSTITCKKSDDDSSADLINKPGNKEAAIAARLWDLDDAINTADKSRILHTLLSFSDSKTFVNLKKDGTSPITSGVWSLQGDTLHLTQSLFNEGIPGSYKIRKLTAAELTLFELYTGAPIEYRYKAK
jgi:hypothetical protein